MEILRAENVSYSYKNKYQTVNAVKSVSCSFEEGRMYAIVGQSGSGKSSFLSLLAGLESPDEGQIFYKGISLKDKDIIVYRKTEISVIYQSLNLFLLLTVLQNVKYPLELNKVKSKAADEIARKSLNDVGISEEKWSRRPEMLSGGEQQRVAIARALAKGGSIIFADEPTGNLDSENSCNITKLLKDLSHNEGVTVIVVTHDLKLAQEADVVYSMKDGALYGNEIV